MSITIRFSVKHLDAPPLAAISIPKFSHTDSNLNTINICCYHQLPCSAVFFFSKSSSNVNSFFAVNLQSWLSQVQSWLTQLQSHISACSIASAAAGIHSTSPIMHVVKIANEKLSASHFTEKFFHWQVSIYTCETFSLEKCLSSSHVIFFSLKTCFCLFFTCEFVFTEKIVSSSSHVKFLQTVQLTGRLCCEGFQEQVSLPETLKLRYNVESI